MNKIDIIIPGMIIFVVVFTGVFFITEWQAEQTAFNSLSPEDQAMTQLAENLRKTDQTNCTELSQVFDHNTNEIILNAIIMKQKELGCNEAEWSMGIIGGIGGGGASSEDTQ